MDHDHGGKPTVHKLEHDVPTAVASEPKPTGRVRDAKPRLIRPQAVRVKAGRLRYPLLIALASLSFLASILLFINTSISASLDVLQVRLQVFEDRYNGIATEYDVNHTISERFRYLETYSLERRSFETHNECLARAITFADDQFWGLPYEKHPDTLNGTIEWAEGTCSRLVFTPQLPTPCPRLAILRSLRTMSESSVCAYQWAMKVGIKSVSWVAGWLESKFPHKKPTEQVMFATGEDADPCVQLQFPFDCIRRKSNEWAAGLMQEARSLELPPNYRLDCSGLSVCHLSCTSNPSPAQDLVPMTVVSQIRNTILRLLTLKLRLLTLASWIWGFLAFVVMPLQATTTFACLFLHVRLGSRTKPRDRQYNKALANRLPTQQRRLIVSLGVQAVLSLLSTLRKNDWLKDESTYLSSAPIAFPCMAGGVMVFIFFLPIKGGHEDISNLIWAVEELYTIWSKGETLMLPGSATEKKPPTNTGNDVEVKLDLPRRVFSSTSLQEDIQLELEELRAEKEGLEDEKAVWATIRAEHSAWEDVAQAQAENKDGGDNSEADDNSESESESCSDESVSDSDNDGDFDPGLMDDGLSVSESESDFKSESDDDDGDMPALEGQHVQDHAPSSGSEAGSDWSVVNSPPRPQSPVDKE